MTGGTTRSFENVVVQNLYQDTNPDREDFEIATFPVIATHLHQTLHHFLFLTLTKELPTDQNKTHS